MSVTPAGIDREVAPMVPAAAHPPPPPALTSTKKSAQILLQRLDSVRAP